VRYATQHQQAKSLERNQYSVCGQHVLELADSHPCRGNARNSHQREGHQRKRRVTANQVGRARRTRQRQDGDQAADPYRNADQVQAHRVDGHRVVGGAGGMTG
jgi:hypothetical protein